MKYKLTFITGSKSGAGTDADVSIRLIGKKKNSAKLQLNTSSKNFEKNSIDEFFIETENIGAVQEIAISRGSSFLSSNWFLESVAIEEISTSNIYFFHFADWIKEDKSYKLKAVKAAKYQIEIITGTLPGSSSDDSLSISIVGSEKETSFIELNKYLHSKKFITGHSDAFSFIAEDVGEMSEIKLKLENELFSSNLYLNKINIKKGDESFPTSFLIFNWVKSNEILASNKNLKEYTIKFFTGDVANGGTDANVSMVIYGNKNKTNVIKLNDFIARNAFEAGNTDFIKLATEDLGEIEKINIWHDEMWLGDGWFLNKITVKEDKSGKEDVFPYYSWLDKSADPKSINIELTKTPVKPRPFYVTAHMVNTPAYVEEALDLGSNAIECDVMPKLIAKENFKFNVFHGFRPDFDPDKINLMERSLANTELTLYLEKLKSLEKKFKAFTLVTYDCKLTKVPKNKLKLCGKQLSALVFKNFYSGSLSNRLYTIFSIPSKKHSLFIDGVLENIPENLKKYIGFDFSEESFSTAEKIFDKKNYGNFWWGKGIAATVPKPLAHFIPEFIIAANSRKERGTIKKIYYWTLDDPDSMERILVTNLDGIIVNDPLKLLRVLTKEEFKHKYRLATRKDNPFEVV